jgi:hypothetical protein
MLSLILILDLVLAGKTNGQILGGFFSQQSTELDLYEKQIAYLELYSGYLKKGYEIAQKGLTAIKEIKKGEWNLHEAFFSSLGLVNPAIKNFAPLTDILKMTRSISDRFNRLCQNSSGFSPSELSYLRSVYSGLYSKTSDELSSLIDLLTPGTFTMSDGERIERISAIYLDIQDKYSFSESFGTEANMLAQERAEDQNENDFLRTLY